MWRVSFSILLYFMSPQINILEKPQTKIISFKGKNMQMLVMLDTTKLLSDIPLALKKESP